MERGKWTNLCDADTEGPGLDVHSLGSTLMQLKRMSAKDKVVACCSLLYMIGSSDA